MNGRAERKRKKRPAIREIAVMVGRSPIHVSRILRKKGQYSKETETKIKQAIEEWRTKKKK